MAGRYGVSFSPNEPEYDKVYEKYDSTNDGRRDKSPNG